MGQYYTPVVLSEDGTIDKRLSSWDFNSGCKLMEHSWIGNGFVQGVETLLVGDLPRRVVWAGDYADPELNSDGTPVMASYTRDNGEEVEYEVNLYHLADELDDSYRPDTPSLGERSNYDWYYKNGKRRKNPKVTTTRDPEIVANAHPLTIPTVETHPFLLNWDKKQYVDKRTVPEGRFGQIHPLPLLTVEGNDRGGGDFHVPVPPTGDAEQDKWNARQTDGNVGNFDLIGSWARDHISVSSYAPTTTSDGKGSLIYWDELVFNLREGLPEKKRATA